ncbi:cache domain-containing protein [Actinoplanes sp. HUAS TT8]|uniref:cache domain-containing protein n=1 Tax=Actinoplanes sp. HUAS TT8 TaxID=3447453 RepID=UPI003F51D4CC
MGQTTARTTAPALADHVAALVEQTFTTVDGLRAQAEAAFAAAGPLTSTTLNPLRPHVNAALGGLISGAGVITVPLTDGLPGLEWWMGADPAQRTRLVLDVDPDSDTYVDLRRMPWFSVPLETGRRHLTGPYVDYVCAEQYTLTFTIPVRAGTQVTGIAGADVTVGDLERVLRPALRAVGLTVALVNSHGRVIAGSTAQHITGSLLRDPNIGAAILEGTSQSLPDGVHVHPCGALPLAVVTWPAPR